MNDKVLLVGNGINNIEQNYQWKNLLDQLMIYINAANKINKGKKPFPLLYEEIYVEAIKNSGLDEYSIKRFISNNVLKLEPNIIHKKIVNAGISNILTTNYDFTLEKALDYYEGFQNVGVIKESTYSIFRHNCIKNLRIWHIHGDANQPNSITLGYEHYSGYLQQMRNYIVSGTGNAYKRKFKPLIKRISIEDSATFSWLDFFFKKDI